jgi:hypothetical protein
MRAGTAICGHLGRMLGTAGIPLPVLYPDRVLLVPATAVDDAT